MTVYVVLRTYTLHFENDACWDGDYYDDYYEDTVQTSEIICICLNEELAKKIAEREDNKLGGENSAYYVPYEVLESDCKYEELFLSE